MIPQIIHFLKIARNGWRQKIEDLSITEIQAIIEQYGQAALRARKCGFDGVELHAANGYLLEQFLSPQTNQRSDAWGGSVTKRQTFVLEVTQAVAAAIGGRRVGIRLSPYGVNAGMKPYPEIDDTYRALVKALIPTGVQFIWVVDHSSMGAPPVSADLKKELRKLWPRTFILGGGFDAQKGQAALDDKSTDLVGFGRNFLANPDFVARAQKGLALNAVDFTTLYTPGTKGYTDYPSAT